MFKSTANALMLFGLIVIVSTGGAIALRSYGLAHRAGRLVRRGRRQP